ncbi:MAG: hypothetical protein LKM30_05180 [Bacilli bacterium]|jgi:hypothetical protein|nr:hypothetical protein [Bacilli bacterium]
MITIRLLGMDTYQAIDVTRKVHAALVKIYGIGDNELEFYASEGFIIHDGIEQTNYRLNIIVEAPEQYEELENDVKDALVSNLKDIAVNFHILFRYFQPEHDYIINDDSYPVYMTDSNTVKATTEAEEAEEKQTEEEESEEPYMGDIIAQFDNYVKDHPNATNKEIYDALAGIREEVTAKHHEKKES